jgi:Lsr2
VLLVQTVLWSLLSGNGGKAGHGGGPGPCGSSAALAAVSARAGDQAFPARFTPHSAAEAPAARDMRPHGPGTNVTPAASGMDSTEVREWAKAQGIEVKDRGRIPAELVARFKAATRQ